MRFFKSVFKLGILSFSIQMAHAEDNVAVLQSIKVTAKAASQYFPEHNTAATKFTLNDLDTPQNVQVLSNQILKDINAQHVTDAVALVSGVNKLNPMGGLWDNFSVRGFNTDQTIGLKILRNGVNAYLGTNATHNIANIERLEFLKGPEAALYGSGEPGGSLNIITKKPQFESEHTLDVRLGSYDQFHVGLDSTGALNSTVAYRLGVAYDDNHSFRDYVNNNSLFLAPQLTWQPSDTTQVDYDSEYTRIKSLFDRGTLVVNGRLGEIPKNRFLGEPNDGLMDMQDDLQQLWIRHDWNDVWQSNAVLNYKHNHWAGFSSEAYQLLNNDGDLNRERRFRHYDTTSYLFNHELKGEFATGTVQHKLVFGTEISRLDISQELYRYRVRGSTASEINIYQPEYGVNLPATSLAYNTQEQQDNAALTFSDYMQFNPQWALLLGGRFDYFQQDFSELKSATAGSQNFNHFSPKAALNYRVNDTTSVYASVGQSFHLNSGLSKQNQAFAPEQAWSYEIGLKNKAWNDRLNSSISVFHIQKNNVLTPDPNDSAYSIAAGQEKSQGIELDFSAQATERLNLKLNYAYIDATVAKSNDASLPIGSRLLNSPKQSANLFAVYRLWQVGSQFVDVGGNIQYVAARAGDPKDQSFELPAYSLVNLNLAYQMSKKTRVQLNINNLFNKVYYPSSIKQLWVTQGNPREAFISLTHQF